MKLRLGMFVWPQLPSQIWMSKFIFKLWHSMEDNLNHHGSPSPQNWFRVLGAVVHAHFPTIIAPLPSSSSGLNQSLILIDYLLGVPAWFLDQKMFLHFVPSTILLDKTYFHITYVTREFVMASTDSLEKHKKEKLASLYCGFWYVKYYLLRSLFFIDLDLMYMLSIVLFLLF